MKIGILTFHYSINTGSVMQAFSVYNIFKNKFPDAQIEIINLIPFRREVSEWNFFSTKWPFFKFHNFYKYVSTRFFVYKNLPLSKLSFANKFDKQIKFINSLKYDLLVSGSDTVFMHSPKLNNLLPSIYYLPNELKGKKISISASVDPLKDISPFLLKKIEICDSLNQFEFVTVRDTTTFNTLHDIGVKNLFKIADPTILFDFEKKLKLETKNIPNPEPKKVLVWLSDPKIEQLLVQLISRFQNLEIINKNKRQTFGNTYIERDLNVYSEIDIVITDRFHRSIFAFKLSKALVILIESEKKNPIPNSKGRDLFNNIGLPEYCVRFESATKELFIQTINNLISSYSKETIDQTRIKFDTYTKNSQLYWNQIMSKLNLS